MKTSARLVGAALSFATLAGTDTAPPELLYAGGSPTMTHVRVWFSEPVDSASGGNASNYALSDGVRISAAVVEAAPNDKVVVLTTSPQPEGGTLTLRVSHVKDLSGNAIAAESAKEFGTHLWLPGQVLHEFWNNISGGVSALRANSRFPRKPTLTTFEPRFEFPPEGANSFADNYGNKLSTWFVPPRTGDYVFFTCSDDPSELYLSTDANPVNKKLIAQETGWSNPRTWTSASEGSAVTKRSDTFARSEWPPSRGGPIRLEAGQKYYLETLHTEGSGGDHASATFVMLGEGDPQDGDQPRLTGEVIGYYLDPNVEVRFTKEPADVYGVRPSTSFALLAKDFAAENGGFTVENTSPAAPGPWLYEPGVGRWVAEGSTPRANGCDGPYASRLNSPEVTLDQDGTVSFSFSHRYSFEPRWDGGQVWLKLNGGPYRRVAPNNFIAHGYAPTPVAATRELGAQRAFNGDSPGYHDGDFVTSRVLLGAFSRGDRLAMQFLAAWDACTTGSHPNWEIASVNLELWPMAIQDFAKSDGGFTVENSAPPPPGSWGHVPSGGTWAVRIGEESCQGPFASILTSPSYIVPRTDQVSLSFTHSYSFQNDGRDAGQVRISVNGSPFTPLAAEKFASNGYPAGVIGGSGLLQGQSGFNGETAFVTSSAMLGKLNQNDSIAVQFVGAWDACSGGRTSSWQIKKVQVHFGDLPQALTLEGQAVATLYGEARPVAYQWQRQEGTDFVDIAGANNAARRFVPSAADFDTAFRLRASVPGKTVASRPVRLVSEPIVLPTITITSSNGQSRITFTGALQAASNVSGPYAEVVGAVSPYAVPSATPVTFFRSVK